MVAVILTRAGFEDMRSRIDRDRDAIWAGADVLSTAEADHLRASGVNLTVFAHRLDPQHLAGDIGTVAEHRPGQVLWVETPMELQ
jgi:hypothetical protein